MEKQQIEEEFAKFFEWPTEDKSQISTTSTMLFAEHIAALAEANMREKLADAEALCVTLTSVRRERDELREAIRLTLDENGHLADGDVCTLIRLKLALRSNAALRGGEAVPLESTVMQQED